jgi:hypothetical protein
MGVLLVSYKEPSTSPLSLLNVPPRHLIPASGHLFDFLKERLHVVVVEHRHNVLHGLTYRLPLLPPFALIGHVDATQEVEKVPLVHHQLLH